MNRTALVCFFILLPFSRTEALLSQDGLVYPHLALGGGCECALFVSNASGLPFNALVSLRQGQIDNWAGTWTVDGADELRPSGFLLRLAPGETRKIVLRGNEEIETGYLTINGDSVDQVAFSFFYNLYDQEGRLMDSTAVGAGEIADAHVFPVERTAQVNTGVAILSHSFPRQPTILAELFDEAGGQIDETRFFYEGR